MARQKTLTVWCDGESKAGVQEIDRIRAIDKQGRVEFPHASPAEFVSEDAKSPDSWRSFV